MTRPASRHLAAASGARLLLGRSLAVSLLLATLMACGDEPAGTPSVAPRPPRSAPASDDETRADGDALSFWRARADTGATLLLLGNVAVSEESRLRFDRVIEDAFASADALVLPNDSALSKQNALIGWKAHLAEGDALANWIPAEMHAAYTRAIGAGGFPPGTAEVTAPWFASRIVQMADRKRAGFVPPSEFETYFVHRAKHDPPQEPGAAPKEILALEESATTYDRYAALSKPLQTQVMRAALLASAVAGDTLPATQRAWQHGETGHLAALFDAPYQEDPALLPSRDATSGAESARVATELQRLLTEAAPGATLFALVPALDLVGDGGVLARLAAAGVTVEQLTSAEGNGTLRPEPELVIPPAPAAEPPPGDRRRALIVGIDGATLRVISPMMEAGRLPVLAQLAAAGASGPLRSHRPIYSPRIWNSISTGKTPEHHGIEGFTYKDDEGTQQLYLSIHRKAHALWNITSDAGLSVSVVNWWNTYPPEKIRGVMVSDHAKPTRLGELQRLTGAATDEIHGDTVHPPEWSARVAAVFGDRRGTRAISDPFLGNVGIPLFMQREELSKRYYDDDAAARIATLIDEATAPDLLMVFLPGIDRVSHRLWAALEPEELYPEGLRLSPVQREAVRAALYRYYDYTDLLVGSLVRRYGPDDLVVVLSDHGFEAGEHLGDLTGVHDTDEALDGVLFARGPGIAAGSRTDGTSVNDITPTLLSWLGLPLALDMDGRPAAFLTPPGETPAAVATYDTGTIERLERSASGNEDEILDQLRALGYIE